MEAMCRIGARALEIGLVFNASRPKCPFQMAFYPASPYNRCVCGTMPFGLSAISVRPRTGHPAAHVGPCLESCGGLV